MDSKRSQGTRGFTKWQGTAKDNLCPWLPERTQTAAPSCSSTPAPLLPQASRTLQKKKKKEIYILLAANKDRSGRFLQTTKNYALLAVFFFSYFCCPVQNEGQWAWPHLLYGHYHRQQSSWYKRTTGLPGWTIYSPWDHTGAKINVQTNFHITFNDFFSYFQNIIPPTPNQQTITLSWTFKREKGVVLVRNSGYKNYI